jgi:hypothetical protein
LEFEALQLGECLDAMPKQNLWEFYAYYERDARKDEVIAKKKKRLRDKEKFGCAYNSRAAF